MTDVEWLGVALLVFAASMLLISSGLFDDDRINL